MGVESSDYREAEGTWRERPVWVSAGNINKDVAERIGDLLARSDALL